MEDTPVLREIIISATSGDSLVYRSLVVNAISTHPRQNIRGMPRSYLVSDCSCFLRHEVITSLGLADRTVSVAISHEGQGELRRIELWMSTCCWASMLGHVAACMKIVEKAVLLFACMDCMTFFSADQ